MNWCPEATAPYSKLLSSQCLWSLCPAEAGPALAQPQLLEVAWETHPALLLALEEASGLARLRERNELPLGHHGWEPVPVAVF